MTRSVRNLHFPLKPTRFKEINLQSYYFVNNMTLISLDGVGVVAEGS